MKTFDMLPKLTGRAKYSKFWLRILNVLLNRMIPFNRPHGFRIYEIGDNHVKTAATYKRANHNHIRGIHACAIATVAEMSAGILLLSKLDPDDYRLIMSGLAVDYRYQAKEMIISHSTISAETISREIVDPLQESDAVTIEMQSRVEDVAGNDVALARTTWQIKKWDQVQTRV